MFRYQNVKDWINALHARWEWPDECTRLTIAMERALASFLARIHIERATSQHPRTPARILKEALREPVAMTHHPLDSRRPPRDHSRPSAVY